MFRSLRWKFLLIFVVVTIFSTTLVNSVWKSWYIADIERLVNDKWVALLSYASHFQEDDELFEYLEFIGSLENDSVSITLYNQQFESTWHNEKSPSSQSQSQHAKLLQLANQEASRTHQPYEMYIDRESSPGKSVHIVYRLIYLHEIHYIVAEIPIHAIIENQLQYKIPILYTFIVFLCAAGLVVGQYVWKDIFLPIDRITTIVKRVSRGQLDHQIFVDRKDEINILASSVNQMINSNREKVTELSDEKSKLEGVLNNMLSGVVLINQKAQVEYVNLSAEKILGIKKEILISKSHKQSLNEYGLNEYIGNALKQGEVYRDQIRIHRGATEHVVEVSIVPIKNINRLITSVIVVLHDISEIKRLEQMRAEFVANVSHEIKTPITSIKGFAETIIDGAIDDRQTTIEFTTIIYNEANRLANLVQDLLELSKIESSNAAIEKQEEDVVEIASDVIANLSNELKKNDMDISLYSNRTHIFHFVNRDRMKQVFINLFSNAISYSKGQSTVYVRVFDNVGDIVIEVEDNGIGIPEKDVPRIFERFYRVHKDRSRSTGGTGLGLSIVKHIVEVHQGSIEVESEVGIGTTFRITFPKDMES